MSHENDLCKQALRHSEQFGTARASELVQAIQRLEHAQAAGSQHFAHLENEISARMPYVQQLEKSVRSDADGHIHRLRHGLCQEIKERDHQLHLERAPCREAKHLIEKSQAVATTVPGPIARRSMILATKHFFRWHLVTMSARTTKPCPTVS